MRDEQKDLRRLAGRFFDELMILPWEYGAPGLDPKRPFGNSDVECDILDDVLGAEPEGDDGGGPCFSSAQRQYARSLYLSKLIPYLQAKWREQFPEESDE